MTRPSSRLIRTISVSICPRKSSASSALSSPCRALANRLPAGGGIEIGRHGAGVAVVGGGAPISLKNRRRAARALRYPSQEPVSSPVISPRRATFSRKARKLRIDHQIGPEGGDDPSLPAGGGDLPVVFEGIEGGIRRGDHLDVEAFKEGAGPELRPGQGLRDPVVEFIRIGRIEPLIDAEEEIEDMLEPHPGGRSPEEVVMLGEKTPDLPGIAFDRTAVDPGNPEFFERDALAVEHPEQVMIRDQEQLGGIGKGDIVRIPPGIGVPVGADDGQILDLAVQTAGDPPLGGIAGKRRSSSMMIFRPIAHTSCRYFMIGCFIRSARCACRRWFLCNAGSPGPRSSPGFTGRASPRPRLSYNR